MNPRELSRILQGGGKRKGVVVGLGWVVGGNKIVSAIGQLADLHLY